jgi:DNA-binding CsgD family transcriptional regulator
MPFERARTQLLLGQLQRRHRRRDAAMVALQEALHTFDELGTAIWAEQVKAELARGGLGRRGSEALTATEERVAELAASGMTNRDVAAALFISPKTVEVNLSRIYRKLNIRSRAELYQALVRSTGEAVDRLNTCAASTSTRGQQVRLLTVMAVPADHYAFGVFAAESAELVAQVCDDAGAPAERISSAIGWVRAQDR